VLGCKAWHLTTAFPNPYKEAVLRAARTIPTGSEVIFTAGDIDCRFESGFHNLYRKTGAALDRAIDQTVAAYLDQLRTLFPAERHRLSILAPPAQRGDLGRFGGPDLALLADIGRLFHETLSVGCNARGLAAHRLLRNDGRLGRLRQPEFPCGRPPSFRRRATPRVGLDLD
jgi:hypothetical protein